MTLITRMGRLFRADIHGLLDCLEEPEAVVKQAIREMEEEIAISEQQGRELEHRARALAEDQVKQGRQLMEIQQQIDLCFRSGNETLAKSCIKKRIQIEWASERIRNAAAQLHNEQRELARVIQERREHLAAIIQKLELFTPATSSGLCSGAGGELGVGAKVSDEEVELAYLAEKQARADQSV